MGSQRYRWVDFLRGPVLAVVDAQVKEEVLGRGATASVARIAQGNADEHDEQTDQADEGAVSCNTSPVDRIPDERGTAVRHDIPRHGSRQPSKGGQVSNDRSSSVSCDHRSRCAAFCGVQ